jgi:anti-sigma factor RsiW
MGMSGVHVDAQLLALVERRLALDEQARVEAHLAACARCQAAANDLYDITDGLGAMPAALRTLPVRAAQQWPAVWSRLRGAGPARRPWPQVSVYLSLVSSFLVVVAAMPGGGPAAAPSSVTAGVAAGPQLTPPATVVFQIEATTGMAGLADASAAPTLSGTEAVQPIPIPTPVPGP